LIINTCAVLPGAVFFPFIITTFGSSTESGRIWYQFIVSFAISTVFMTVQTFFLLQSYLTAYLYPEFFRDARPESVPGIVQIAYWVRLLMMWAAVALMPLVALLFVVISVTVGGKQDIEQLKLFSIGLVAISAVSGVAIFWLVGQDLRRWIHLQTDAT